MCEEPERYPGDPDFCPDTGERSSEDCSAGWDSYCEGLIVLIGRDAGYIESVSLYLYGRGLDDLSSARDHAQKLTRPHRVVSAEMLDNLSRTLRWEVWDEILETLVSLYQEGHVFQPDRG